MSATRPVTAPIVSSPLDLTGRRGSAFRSLGRPPSVSASTPSPSSASTPSPSPASPPPPPEYSESKGEPVVVGASTVSTGPTVATPGSESKDDSDPEVVYIRVRPAPPKEAPRKRASLYPIKVDPPTQPTKLSSPPPSPPSMHGLPTPPVSLNDLFIRGVEKQNALMNRIKEVQKKRGCQLTNLSEAVEKEMEKQAEGKQDDPDWLQERIAQLDPTYQKLTGALRLVCSMTMSARHGTGPTKRIGPAPLDADQELARLEQAHQEKYA